MQDADGAPAASARSRADTVVRNLLSVGVVMALMVGAFLALNKNPEAEAAPAEDTGAERAAAASDLVVGVGDHDDVWRATGGYVPGIGIVITAEVESLEVSDIESWTGSLIRNADPVVTHLPDGEEIVFLLDIAEPTRTSRLISVIPGDAGMDGDVERREAPAVSTAPLQPVFDDEPAE